MSKTFPGGTSRVYSIGSVQTSETEDNTAKMCIFG